MSSPTVTKNEDGGETAFREVKLLSRQSSSVHPGNHDHSNNSDDEDCISELEKCSLQDNEKCHCLWQVLRAVHGIFHWLNTLTCIRHRRNKCDEDGKQRSSSLENEQELELIEKELNDAIEKNDRVMNAVEEEIREVETKKQ